MGETKIEWTDRTWNPVRGCSMAKGSETGGCLNCYAARMAARNLPEMKSPTTGEAFARILPSGPRWTGKVELIEHLLSAPLKWKKPQKIFVNSMSDLWHEDLPVADIAHVYAQMYIADWHTYQVLTKRPEKRLQTFNDAAFWTLVSKIAGRDCVPGATHIWEGVSCENQTTAEARIPILLQTPAAVRFISYEPALGPVDFNRELGAYAPGNNSPLRSSWLEKLSWIIVGGESGPGARPFDIQWARNTIEQCKAAGVACFVKQLGAKPFWSVSGGLGVWAAHVRFKRETSREAPYHWDNIILKDRKGGDWHEWPEDLYVREFPGVLSSVTKELVAEF